jgi:mannose-1-phosphate guanylyltransferase
VGVTDVVLAVNFKAEAMVAAMRGAEAGFGIKVHFSIEEESRAAPILEGTEPFLVLNSDVICEFPFSHLIAFHRSYGGEGTLMTTPVQDPSKFGVVVLRGASGGRPSTLIDQFVEKPKEYVGDHTNAGIYIFSPSILKRIPVGFRVW